MNMKVSTISYDELPEDVKEEQPDNGSGKEYANYIKVEIEGEVDLWQMSKCSQQPIDCSQLEPVAVFLLRECCGERAYLL